MSEEKMNCEAKYFIEYYLLYIHLPTWWPPVNDNLSGIFRIL